MTKIDRSSMILRGGVLLAMTLMVGACVFDRATTAAGTTLYTVSPKRFVCPDDPALQLSVQQDRTGDASAIDCAVSDPDHANAWCDDGHDGGLRLPGTPAVQAGEVVRWSLRDPNQVLYLTFENDLSPAYPNDGDRHRRGLGPTSSERGELCLRTDRRAEGEYRYSVYVQYCDKESGTCQPRVLDPIIYVMRR